MTRVASNRTLERDPDCRKCPAHSIAGLDFASPQKGLSLLRIGTHLLIDAGSG